MLAVAQTAKPRKALRQASPAAIAMGAAIATPQPVPQLIVDSVRARTVAGSRSTASANGGCTSPALAPAVATPRASTAGPWATAMTVVPATASSPPATTVAR